MATISAEGTHRRRRNVASASSHAAPQLSDLPWLTLTHVAHYLPLTSRALFAVAMTAPSDAWERAQWKGRPSEVAVAILRRQGRDVTKPTSLDFLDVDKRCRERLTDGDIGGVLVCIGAKARLKSLTLTHCFRLTGAALEPLRGSSVLERIDLSLVGQHERPGIDLAAPISEEAVLPILHSIIDAPGSKLVHVQFPKKWRERKSAVLTAFLRRYERYMNGHRHGCAGPTIPRDLHCPFVVQGTDRQPWVYSGDEDEFCYGIQRLTCGACMQHFCVNCCSQSYVVQYCASCERYYCRECCEMGFCRGSSCFSYPHRMTTFCRDCVKLKRCDRCARSYCPDCDSMVQCGKCSRLYCNRCTNRVYQCQGRDCRKGVCKECADDAEEGAAVSSEDDVAVHSCTTCNRRFCMKCLVKECKRDWEGSCTDCVTDVARVLSNRTETLERRNRALSGEIERLNQQNEELLEQLDITSDEMDET